VGGGQAGPSGPLGACRCPQGPASGRGTVPCTGNLQITLAANPKKAVAEGLRLCLSHTFLHPELRLALCCVKGYGRAA